MDDLTPDHLLSWRQGAGLIAALVAGVAAFYAVSSDIVTCAVGILLAVVCVGIPILMNLQAQKEKFLDDFERTEGR